MPPVGGIPRPALPPAPAPRANLYTGNNPRGVAIAQPPAPFAAGLGRAAGNIGASVSQGVRSAVPYSPPRGGGSDILTSGPGYGSGTANAYKQTPAYKQAVVSVFKAQSPAQQHAILTGAVQNPTGEGKMVLDYLQGLRGQAGSGPSTAAITSPATLRGLAQLGVSIPSGAVSLTGGLGKILGNTAKDAWNLAPGTVEGMFGLGKAIVTGHEANAFHMLVDPYVQLAEHPLKTIGAHPLNSALMLAAPESMVGRGAGFAARAGVLGDAAKAAASTVRDPLSVGTIAGEPSPITEARAYSPNVINKAFQVSREKVIASRGQNPNISRPVPNALPASAAYTMNVGTRAKLYRGTDEMTATHQTMQRAERTQALRNFQKAAPAVASRNIVSHVLQGVIRTPKTAVEDISKEINRLKAAQTGKRTVGEIQNRQQVRDLSTALKTPGAVDQAFQAAAPVRAAINAQDPYLVQHALLDGEQAARSKVMPYAIAHMGAKYDHSVGALVNADGTPLGTQAIFDHLKVNGVPDPAYVGHFPGKVSPGRFYSSYKLARGTLGNGKRTGEAFRAGTYDHTWNGLAGQMASRAQAVAKAGLHDSVLNRYGITIPPAILDRLGIKSPNGDFTPAEAKAIAHAAMVDDHGNPVPNALELTPISRAPAHVLGEVKNLQHPQELNNISQVELQALAHAVTDAAQRTDGTRNVALIPSDVAQRFAQQYAKTDTLLRSVGRVTQQFRRTVLPYSTHWMTQIGSEAGLRAMFAGLHPRDLVEGRALMKHLETTPEGRAALAEMVNSTLYSGGGSSVRDALMGRAGRGNLDVHNPNANPLASAAKAFPPSRLLIAAHNRYADTVTAGMYSLEHNARVMGLGHLAHKEVQSFGFSWRNAVKLQGQSIAQLGDKLKSDPALVAKFGRSIDNTFGKYNKFTPTQRAMIQSFMPFLPWYLNAAKYVLWHLPAHHPVSSALLASLRQTIAQDVQDGKQAPLNTYAMQELARISPFGIFSPTSTKPATGAALAGQQITGAFLPQLEGSFYNLAGLNSFGDSPLKQAPSAGNTRGIVKPKSGPALAAALENLVESVLPGVRYARLAEEGGRPAYGTSTLLSPQPKPGGAGGAGSILNRIFNPFYSFERASGSGPAYGPKPPAGSTTGGGWGGSTGSSAPGWGAPATTAAGWG